MYPLVVGALPSNNDYNPKGLCNGGRKSRKKCEPRKAAESRLIMGIQLNVNLYLDDYKYHYERVERIEHKGVFIRLFLENGDVVVYNCTEYKSVSLFVLLEEFDYDFSVYPF